MLEARLLLCSYPHPLSFSVQKGQKHHPYWGAQLSLPPEFPGFPSGPGHGSWGTCSPYRVEWKKQSRFSGWDLGPLEGAGGEQPSHSLPSE